MPQDSHQLLKPPMASSAMDWDKNPILSNMWRTKGSRFAAHQRLTKKYYMNVYSVSLLSFYVICISVFITLSGQMLTETSRLYLTMLSVGLSIFIIILSLVEGSKNHLLRAETLHGCARDIVDLYNKYRLAISQGQPRDEEHQQRYQDILNKCPFNHDPIDYSRVMAENPAGFSIKHPHLYGMHVIATHIWNIYGIQLALLIIPPILFAVSLS